MFAKSLEQERKVWKFYQKRIIELFQLDKKLFWIDDDKAFMRQGSWSRPITSASFFLKEKIEWMEKNPDMFKINSQIKIDEGWKRSIQKDKLEGFNQL